MVSIIIPYIDEYDYLAEAVTSAVNQHGMEKEIIVVCNALQGSGSDQIPDEYLSKIKLIHEPNPGSAHARNTGLVMARGEWVQFLDVDDLLLPEKIELQSRHEMADVVVSPHTYRYINGKEEKSKWLPDDIWTGLLNSGLGSTSSMLWKRKALLEVGGWNASTLSHQEYELLFRLLTAGGKVIADESHETIVRQRQNGSITANTRTSRIAEGIQLRESMWYYLLTNNENTARRFNAFRQYIFKQMRGLYRYDRAAGLNIFSRYFEKEKFFPADMHIPGYGLLYSLFGFQMTEAIIRFFIFFRK